MTVSLAMEDLPSLSRHASTNLDESPLPLGLSLGLSQSRSVSGLFSGSFGPFDLNRQQLLGSTSVDRYEDGSAASFTAAMPSGSTDQPPSRLMSMSNLVRGSSSGLAPLGANLQSFQSNSVDRMVNDPNFGSMPTGAQSSFPYTREPNAVFQPSLDQQVQSSQSAQPELQPANKAPATALEVPSRKRRRSSAVALGSSARGAHVRGRPVMQETARAGQQHWAQEVKRKREEWAQMEAEQQYEKVFKEQIDMCVRCNIKSQKECLLRYLHLSTAGKLIRPDGFAPLKDGDDRSSFFGWKGFTVCSKANGAKFKAGVNDMFGGDNPKQNTVQNLFRRAGLVPDDWVQAWEGAIPFRFTTPALLERKKA